MKRKYTSTDDQLSKKIAKTYNQKVQHIEFFVGDLVLRKAIGNVKDSTNKKLSPNW